MNKARTAGQRQHGGRRLPAKAAEPLAILEPDSAGLDIGKAEIYAAVPPDRVLLMPQGLTRDDLDSRSAWLSELCKRHGFRFCARLHIELYGNRRGT